MTDRGQAASTFVVAALRLEGRHMDRDLESGNRLMGDRSIMLQLDRRQHQRLGPNMLHRRD